jgi:RP/EB family microtubule-associated protein
MARVKMNAKHEYEYIANFKVMQTAFKTKKIDKVSSVRYIMSSYI